MVDQRIDKHLALTGAGAGKRKAEEFDPARRVADLAKAGKAFGQGAGLPDQQPLGGIGQRGGQRGFLIVPDEGGIGRVGRQRPDKGESRPGWPDAVSSNRLGKGAAV